MAYDVVRRLRHGLRGLPRAEDRSDAAKVALIERARARPRHGLHQHRPRQPARHVGRSDGETGEGPVKTI